MQSNEVNKGFIFKVDDDESQCQCKGVQRMATRKNFCEGDVCNDEFAVWSIKVKSL